MKSDKYFVVIVHISDNSLDKRIECKSLKDAQRVERGVNINLNHDKYFTTIEKGKP